MKLLEKRKLFYIQQKLKKTFRRIENNFILKLFS